MNSTMAAPLTTTNGSDSTDAVGNRFVALCTGATGISSVHLIRHLQKDPRFSKVYGVSRRELYDVDSTHAEHIKLDLLDSQKVKEVLKSKGVSDGMCLCSKVLASLSHSAGCMQHPALTPPLLVCSDPPVSGMTLQAQRCLRLMAVLNVKPVHTLLQMSGLHACCRTHLYSLETT